MTETKECPFCGETILKVAKKCKHCGEYLEYEKSNLNETVNFTHFASTENRREASFGWRKPMLTSNLIILLIIITITAVIFLGNFHIITGGGVGLKVVKRDYFGFTEIFIDVNEITGMPEIAAQYKYPYGCRVLAREDIIESNEEHKNRITRENRENREKTEEINKAIVRTIIDKQMKKQ